MTVRNRSSYLGGSDAAGVLGLSRWDTPLSVWAEKTGQFVKPDLESEAAELGKELEDYVAKRFSRKTGKSVVVGPGTYFHPQYDFLGANLDRIVDGEDAILECKTCSAWKSKEWEGEEIPQEYVIQCFHYLLVTGRQRAYIAVLVGNSEFKWKVIERDEAVLRDMLRREVSFWEEFVLTGIMPTVITRRDTETLDSLFPVAEEGKVIQLGDEADRLVEALSAFKQDRNNLENEIERMENELKAMLKEAERGITSKYEIGWRNSKLSRLDGKALKEAYPDIHRNFYKTTPNRRFAYKPIGGDK